MSAPFSAALPTERSRPALPFAPDRPWLAPLAGFSDLPFRLLCREFGASAAVTEMISAKGLVHESPGTSHLLATCAMDAPLAVQLFGCEEHYLERAMGLLLERGFTHFDLNCGCSVPKVVKTGSGAALLRDTGLLVRLARIMARMAGPGRAGVKMRLGWTFENACHRDLSRRLEDAGTAWLALHPRSARQGFSGIAAWEEIASLVREVSLPVLASGDLFTAADAAKCLRRTGAAGVMFARGALRDPAVFSRFTALLAGEKPLPPTGAETARIVRRHMELIHEYGDPRKSLLKMRTAVPRYIRGLAGARKVRDRLVHCSSWEELDDIVEEIATLLPADPAPENEPGGTP